MYKKIRILLCKLFGWHKPTYIECHGINFVSKCKYCGKDIIMNSQGGWFES